MDYRLTIHGKNVKKSISFIINNSNNLKNV